MFNKILVALDGSPETASALLTARTLALAGNGRIVLLRVVPPKLDPREQQECAFEAATYLERCKSELKRFALQIRTHAPVGEPAEEILRVIELEHADLVVMATHASSGLERLFLRSVTEQIVAESPCQFCCWAMQQNVHGGSAPYLCRLTARRRRLAHSSQRWPLHERAAPG